MLLKVAREITSAFTGLKTTLESEKTLCADNEARTMLELSLSLYEDVLHVNKQLAECSEHLTPSTRIWIEKKIEGAHRALDRVIKLVPSSNADSQTRRLEHLYSKDEFQGVIKQLESSKTSLLSANPYLVEAMRQKSAGSPPVQTATTTTSPDQKEPLPVPTPHTLSKSNSAIDLKRPKKRANSKLTTNGSQSPETASTPPPEPVASQPSHPPPSFDDTSLNTSSSSLSQVQASSAASSPPTLPHSYSEPRSTARTPALRTALPYPVFHDDVRGYERAAPPTYQDAIAEGLLPTNVYPPDPPQRLQEEENSLPVSLRTMQPQRPMQMSSAASSNASLAAPLASEGRVSSPNNPLATRASAIPLRRPKSRARMAPKKPAHEIHELPL